MQASLFIIPFILLSNQHKAKGSKTKLSTPPRRVQRDVYLLRTVAYADAYELHVGPHTTAQKNNTTTCVRVHLRSEQIQYDTGCPKKLHFCPLTISV